MDFWPAHRALVSVLADVDAHIAGWPADAQAHFLRGCMLRDLGRPDEAVEAFEQAVSLDKNDAASVVALAAALARKGYRDRPRALLEALLEVYPEHPAANVSYANLLGLEQPELAREHLELALTMAPSLKEAHESACSLLAMLGESEAAAFHREAAYADSPTKVMPFRGERWPVPALLLVSTDGGNLYADQMLDDRVFQTTKVYVEAFAPGTSLPPHRIVVNAIADADLNSAVLERAELILSQTTSRVINRPRDVAATRRVDIATRLRGIDGVRVPWVMPFESGNPPDFPFLLRAVGYHMGRHFMRIDGDDSLGRARALLPGSLFTTEYVDTCAKDGWFRKFRAIAVSGEVYPVHMAASKDWKVHYFSSAMFDEATLRDEERTFLEDMRGTIGAAAVAALHEIVATLGLDYAGIDFGFDRAGKLVVFEANAAMTVIQPDDDERFAYRLAPTRRVLDAIRQLTMEEP